MKSVNQNKVPYFLDANHNNFWIARLKIRLFRPMFITELLKGFLLEATYFDVCSANFEGRRTAV